MSVYPRGGVWYYDFWVDGHRYVSRVGPSREAAVDAETVARARALSGRYEREWGLRPRNGSAPKLTLLIDDFRKATLPALAPRWQVTVRGILDRWDAEVGHLTTAQLDTRRLEQIKATRLEAGSPYTAHRDFYWLGRVYRGRGLPFPRLAFPRQKPPPDRILTPAEERALLLAAGPQRDIWELALWTGLSRQDLVALDRRHVDLAGRRIVLQRGKTGVQRSIPLAPSAAAILRRHLHRCVSPDAPVFVTRRGGRYTITGLWEAFRRARARAGIKDLRLHDLRHTVAVRLLRAGWELPVVGDILGHRPPYRTTLRYVAHVNEERKRAAVASLQKSQRPRSHLRKIK